jgi:hypothetical protein
LSDRKIGSINAIRPILRSLNPGALTQLKSEVFTGVRYNLFFVPMCGHEEEVMQESIVKIFLKFIQTIAKI